MAYAKEDWTDLKNASADGLSPILKHYGVYWLELDPTPGRELEKTRPAVLISQDELNAVLDTVVIC